MFDQVQELFQFSYESMESVKKPPVKICFLKNWRKKIRQIAKCYGIDNSFDEKSISKKTCKTFRENSEIILLKELVVVAGGSMLKPPRSLLLKRESCTSSSGSLL